MGFWLQPEAAAQLALQNGEPPEALHMTLAFCGDAVALGEDVVAKVLSAMQTFAQSAAPFTGKVSGIGRFVSTAEGGTDVLYASVDAPDLPAFRQALADALEAAGAPPLKDHGFTPHISLAFVEHGKGANLFPLGITPPVLDLTFSALQVRVGDRPMTFPLGREGVVDLAGRIVQKNAKQRFTLGIVYEPDEVDTQGDFAKTEDIEAACWRFMQKIQGRAPVAKMALQVVGAIVKAVQAGDAARLDVSDVWADLAKAQERINDMHLTTEWEDEPEIVECYMAPVDFELNGAPVKKGSWLLGVVWPEAYFAKIEAGERTGYSMEGRGKRVVVDA